MARTWSLISSISMSPVLSCGLEAAGLCRDCLCIAARFRSRFIFTAALRPGKLPYLRVSRLSHMPNAVNAGERERGQCHVPRPDTWRAGMADGGTGAGGEERSTVSIRTSCRINDQTRATVRQCRQAMSADNATYQDRMSGAPAWRAEAQGRADLERETDVPRAVRTGWPDG